MGNEMLPANDCKNYEICVYFVDSPEYTINQDQLFVYFHHLKQQ